MIRILMIEDDKVLAEGVALTLGKEGYEVEWAGTLREGAERLEESNFHLLILDINLPDGNGRDFCRRIKKEMDVPVLMLTADDTEEDEIEGLEAGADEYVTKPFSIGILRARVRLLLRRKQGVKEYHFGELVLNFETRQFFRGDKLLSLSRAETELLFLLVSHADQTLTRDQLISGIWDDYLSVDENTLTVTMGRLKRKLGTNAIHTVYGVGYVWRKGKE